MNAQPGEPLRWLIDYVAARGTVGDRALEELLEEDYLAIGLLDSLGLVQMLVGIEEEFGVWLTPEELQDPRFGTLASLAELVAQSCARAA